MTGISQQADGVLAIAPNTKPTARFNVAQIGARPVTLRTARCKRVYARRESVADALRPDARAFTAVPAVIVAVGVIVERVAKPIPHAKRGTRRVCGRKRVDGVGAQEQCSCGQHHGDTISAYRGHRERQHLSLPREGNGGLGTATTFQPPSSGALNLRSATSSRHTIKKNTHNKKSRL